MKQVNVVWYRRDLRLSDNEIVAQAAQSHKPTLFIFTIDPWFFQQAEVGAQRVRFLLECLTELDANLRRYGCRLHILTGESSLVIQALLGKLVEAGNEPKLYFNADIQVAYGLRRDAEIRTFCSDKNIALHEGQAYFLSSQDIPQHDWYEQYYAYQASPQWHLPDSITSFTDDCLAQLDQIDPRTLFEWAGQYITDLSPSRLFTGGETQAQHILQSFLTQRYHGYHWKLSQPYLAQQGATSQLSPHIAFGTISTRQVSAAAYTMKQRLKKDSPAEVKTLAAFVSRIRWRDHFTQRLLFFPDMIWQNRYPEFDEIYRDEPLDEIHQQRFDAWKAGTTGFPLLDASMRQLAADGWLNFRMRAQAVTMLCLVFGVSWHHGARYFMQQLIDGDIAINHWQWQMQAGITDATSPIFRIYDPTKNLLERDPKLQYIHYWLPEYSDCHTSDAVLAKARPIVDYKTEKKAHGDEVARIRKAVRQRLAASTAPTADNIL